MAILHITDLHIDDPSSGDFELLREGFYEEYIDKLVDTFTPNVTPACAVITGDFVHKGNVDNFTHTTKVVEYLLSKLELDKSHVCVCIGDHDIVRNEEIAGRHDEARAAYTSFADQFANSAGKVVVERKAILASPAPGVKVLCLDSTVINLSNLVTEESHREEPFCLPGSLSTKEADAIVEEVRRIDGDELLVVASHFPTLFPADDVSDVVENDPDYRKKHEWRLGKALRDRIVDNRVRCQGRMLWLSGDIHSPFQVELSSLQYFVSTGRFGTRVPNSNDFDQRDVSSISRQARYIDIGLGMEPTVTTFHYRSRGHQDNPHFGDWESKVSSFRHSGKSTTIDGLDTRRKEADLSLAEAQVAVAPSNANDIRPSLTVEAITSNASPGSIGDRLIDLMQNDSLYSTGRFQTHKNEVSLAWVSIGPLLNYPKIIESVVGEMSTWIQAKCREYSCSAHDVVLLGLDCWGAVLASQVSIITGSHNYCIAARGRGQYSTNHELVTTTVASAVKTATVVVMIADVVATGSTLRWVYDEIRSQNGVNKQQRWIASAIVCDPIQERNIDLSFLECMGAICVDLRMPILSRESLPDDKVLPATISFMRS